MKLLKKVSEIEVKRTFIISDYVRDQNYLGKDMGHVSSTEYRRRVKKAKQLILQLPETILDKILSGQWLGRFAIYQKTQ
jgi:hypothetical protein